MQISAHDKRTDEDGEFLPSPGRQGCNPKIRVSSFLTSCRQSLVGSCLDKLDNDRANLHLEHQDFEVGHADDPKQDDTDCPFYASLLHNSYILHGSYGCSRGSVSSSFRTSVTSARTDNTLNSHNTFAISIASESFTQRCGLMEVHGSVALVLMVIPSNGARLTE